MNKHNDQKGFAVIQIILSSLPVQSCSEGFCIIQNQKLKNPTSSNSNHKVNAGTGFAATLKEKKSLVF